MRKPNLKLKGEQRRHVSHSLCEMRLRKARYQLQLPLMLTPKPTQTKTKTPRRSERAAKGGRSLRLQRPLRQKSCAMPSRVPQHECGSPSQRQTHSQTRSMTRCPNHGFQE